MEFMFAMCLSINSNADFFYFLIFTIQQFYETYVWNTIRRTLLNLWHLLIPVFMWHLCIFCNFTTMYCDNLKTRAYLCLAFSYIRQYTCCPLNTLKVLLPRYKSRITINPEYKCLCAIIPKSEELRIYYFFIMYGITKFVRFRPNLRHYQDPESFGQTV